MERSSMYRVFVLIFVGIAAAMSASAQDWSNEQRDIIEAIARLSAATSPDGGGPDAYADVLAPDFTRWTMGEGPVQGREKWIEGMREWWEDGWRVVDRKTDYLEISVHGTYATLRRIVEETYRGPKGGESRSRTALAEMWVLTDDAWLLLRANAHPLEL
jgi:hypothetical protein